MQKVLNIFKNRALALLMVLVMVATHVKSEDYLKTQPSFLISCNLQNVNSDDKCIAKGLENLFTNWKDGVPGLKTVGKIDPFNVKKIHLEQSQGNVDFKADFKNVVVNGLSHAQVERVSVSKQHNFKLLFKVAKLGLLSDYRVKGRILLLNLDGSGPLQMESTGLEIIAVIKTKLVERSGYKFFDVQEVKSDITNLAGFHINLDNLFGGNRQLETTANELFNNSWRELFGIMRPAISEVIDAIIFDRFKKTLNYVPANYFFTDV